MVVFILNKLCRLWYTSGADIVILLVRLRKERLLSVLADKHSIGTSPDFGLHMYFSASFHFEFNANPSGDKLSQPYIDLACNALRAVVNEYVDGSISSLKVYPGEEAVLEMVKFDLKEDLASSLKLLIYEAENLLEFVFSRLMIRALRPHSFKLNSGGS